MTIRQVAKLKSRARASEPCARHGLALAAAVAALLVGCLWLAMAARPALEAPVSVADNTAGIFLLPEPRAIEEEQPEPPLAAGLREGAQACRFASLNDQSYS